MLRPQNAALAINFKLLVYYLVLRLLASAMIGQHPTRYIHWAEILGVGFSVARFFPPKFCTGRAERSVE